MSFRSLYNSSPPTPTFSSTAASPMMLPSLNTRNTVGGGASNFSLMTPSSSGGGGGMMSSILSSATKQRQNAIFTRPNPAQHQIQLGLQKTMFTKQHEEIYHILHVKPKVKPSLDVLTASFGSSSTSVNEEYYLVLTTNTQVSAKKTSTNPAHHPDGIGAPKLHWVRIKTEGSEVSYQYKKYKFLKLLRRIELSGSNMTTGGTMVGVSSTGTFRKQEKEDMTLVFRSGDSDKTYTFTIIPAPTKVTTSNSSNSKSAPSSPPTILTSLLSPATPSSSDRSVFVWYCLEICRINIGFVPTSNIDTVLYQQLTNEITGYYLNENSIPSELTTHIRTLLSQVTKARSAVADADTKMLYKNKIEEKVIVPNMTQEETALVQVFLKQMEMQQQQQQQNNNTSKTITNPSTPTSSNSTSMTFSTPPPASSNSITVNGSPQQPLHQQHTSYLNDLESYLTHKLTQIEHANIQSLFDPQLEAVNARILNSDIQTNLLDTKLEEMSLWLNHHNYELSKMKKGIELIEKRNMSLDIQEKNQSILYDTLLGVLSNLKLDPDQQENEALEQSLEHPEFSEEGLTQTLIAVRQLVHVLSMDMYYGKLDEILALKQQREYYQKLCTKFTQKAALALEKLFQESARKAVNDANKYESASIDIQTNSIIHRDLKKYIELMRYLEELDFQVFLSLRSKYSSAVRQVYEVKTKLYFTALRKGIAQEHKDTHMIDFPDWNLDIAKSAMRRTEGGRNITISSVAGYMAILKLGPNSGVQQSQFGRIISTHAFIQALGHVTPWCQSEERFLKELFAVSSDIAKKEKEKENGGTAASTAGGASGANSTSTSRLRSNSSSQLGAPSSTATTAPTRPRGPSISGFGGSNAGQTKSSSSRSDSDEIQLMMSDLFHNLEPELKELSQSASKMDHFYTLEMLVECERMMQKEMQTSNAAANMATPPSRLSTISKQPSISSLPTSPLSASKSDFLESIVTSLSTHLKLSFTSFIDSEIEWFNSLKPNPKRCGILQPFLKFPPFVDRMENIVCATSGEGRKVVPGINARSQAADTSYQKLASALFRWLDHIAAQDEKYTDVVYIENTYFFLTIFSTTHLSIPALDQYVIKSQHLYDLHLQKYVQWHIEYEMPILTKFWAKIESALKSSIQPEDIPYASELSKQELRNIVKGPMSQKALQKSLLGVLKRVEKHITKNPLLITTIWRAITSTFLSQLARFESLVRQCYPNEKLEITQQEVSEMMQGLLPESGGKESTAERSEIR